MMTISTFFLNTARVNPYWLSDGSLYDYFKTQHAKKEMIPETQLWKWLLDITNGLLKLHSNSKKIIHRDIKLENILLGANFEAKIADFGVSRILGDRESRAETVAGTEIYMSPQIIKNEPYTEKTDIFSLGVLFYELCTFTQPFKSVI